MGFLDDLALGDVRPESGRRRQRTRSLGAGSTAPPGDDLGVVPYVPFRCPRCGAVPRTYGRRGRTRYHRCRDCSGKFHSLEISPSDVPGFGAATAEGSGPDPSEPRPPALAP